MAAFVGEGDREPRMRELILEDRENFNPFAVSTEPVESGGRPGNLNKLGKWRIVAVVYDHVPD